MKSSINLLDGNLLKTIIKVGTPIALGSLIQTLYNLADAFWLGKLGKEALAAPFISFFILFCIISFGIGFSAAGTTMVAQYIGAGEKQKVNKAAGNLLTVIIFSSIVFAGVGLLIGEKLLVVLNTPGDTFALTLSYYKIY